MPYTEKELMKLIEEVEQKFTAELAKADQDYKLAKAEDSKDKPEEKAAAKPESDKPADEKPAEDKPAESPAEEPKAADEHCDYDDEDMEHMHKMYGSMQKGELKAHHDSIMKCMGKAESAAPHGAEGPESEASKEQDQIAKADGCGGEMEGCEPKDSPGAKSEASKSASGIYKTETGKIEASAPGKIPGAKSEASDANGEKMNKSEADLLKNELESEKTKNEKLEKNFAAVSEFITKLVKKIPAPAGKAITSLDVIAKSEGATEEKALTKSEITACLLKKASDPTLAKSDREAIYAYYASNGSNVNVISHLLNRQ